MKARAGFSTDVDVQLAKAANIESCPEWHKLVVLLLDEMHIKEDLVYDSKMIGFVDLGSINSHLLNFEQSIEGNTNSARQAVLANSMMVIMIRGLLRYPYAHFPCTTITGDLLFQPFWECVFRLERMGFKV